MNDANLLIDPLPTGWKNYQLMDICSHVKNSHKPVEDGNILYVGLEHLAQGFPAFVGQGVECNVKSSKTVFKVGDILFGKLRPYLRKGVQADFDGICSTDILVFRAEKRCESSFLKYLVHTDPFIDYAKSTTTGVQHPRTSWSSLKQFCLSLPPLAEQRKIAYILSTVQRAIDAQERIIQTTTELKKVLLRKLFIEGTRGEPQKQTEIGLIPKSWVVVKLGKIARIERGKFSHRPRNEPRFYGGDFPFVQTGDIANCDGYIRSHVQTLNEEGLAISKMFRKGTILITIAANIGLLESWSLILLAQTASSVSRHQIASRQNS